VAARVKNVTKLQLQRLVRAARAASRRSHAPYSRFPVGAAVLADSGRIHAGCNVENASYGLSICAERAAIFAAVAAGDRRLRCVVVHTPTPAPTLPCGACRQVIREFGTEVRIVAVCDGDERVDTSIAALLPAAFGPENLNR
jgi:cytidine deaminase